jgi:hypothetical protein
MRFPMHTSRLRFLVVSGAEPLKKFENGKLREAWAPRVDRNGDQPWRVQLVALGDEEAQIIRRVVPGDPGVAQGEMVRAEGKTGDPGVIRQRWIAVGGGMASALQTRGNDELTSRASAMCAIEARNTHLCHVRASVL